MYSSFDKFLLKMEKLDSFILNLKLKGPNNKLLRSNIRAGQNNLSYDHIIQLIPADAALHSEVCPS